MATTITLYEFHELAENVQLNVIKTHKEYVMNIVHRYLKEIWDEHISEIEDYLKQFPNGASNMRYTQNYVASQIQMSMFPAEAFDIDPYTVERTLDDMCVLAEEHSLWYSVCDALNNARINYRCEPLPVVLCNVMRQIADSATNFITRMRTSDKYVLNYIKGVTSVQFNERSEYFNEWQFTENGDVISKGEES